MNERSYVSMSDVVEYEVKPALGDSVGDFDVEAIARECWKYDGAQHRFVKREDVDFWECVKENDISDN